MPLKKYAAEKDATITNAYKADRKNLAFDSNTGAADSLEIFSIFGDVTGNSVEKSRIVIQFNVDSIQNDITSGKIPSSGVVKYFFRLKNVEHTESTPKRFTVLVSPLAQEWEEGYGIDLDNHSDRGITGLGVGNGVTWKYANKNEQWLTNGGTIVPDLGFQKTQAFEIGNEDLNIDITNIVEAWLADAIPNYGLLVKLSGSFEDGSDLRSYYTKKFSARSSEFFFGRPSLDVVWEDVIQDNRKNFFRTSPTLSNQNNTMNLYFYNRINGKLKNLPGDVIPVVYIYSNPSLDADVTQEISIVTNPLPGIYKLETRLYTESEAIYDVWRDGDSGAVYHKNSAVVYERENNLEETDYNVKIINLKTQYGQEESVKFSIFSRPKDWQPNILVSYSNTIETEVLNDLYYRIIRVVDNYIVVDYSLESPYYTKCASDNKGNYFTLDMSILEPGYVYKIKLARINDGMVEEFKEEFKFRVY